MSIKARRAGFTLVEILVTVTVTALVVAAGAVLAYNFMHSVAFLTNAVDLDAKSRLAIDHLSREIRQCDVIHSGSSNRLVLRLGTNLTSYVYYPESRELVRSTAEDEAVPYLIGCDYFRFDMFGRNPVTGAYDKYPTAVAKDCKVVQLNWVCSRDLLGIRANTTTMQSAKVVIRKQQ